MVKINNKKMAGAGFGLLASLLWGAWPVISKLATNDNLLPADLTALRFGVAGCLLLPVLLYQGIKLKYIARKGIILAIAAGAPYVLLATSGLSFAPNAHFGIIAPSSMLVFATIGSVLWLREPIRIARVLGVLLILSGILVVGGNSLSDVSIDTLLGDLMFLGCGLLWASYTLLCKHWDINPWTATALVSVVSMFIYLPIYLFGFDSQLSHVSINTLVLQGLFQGVVVAILALYFYSKAVTLLGSGKGAIFTALVPPVSMLLGAILLNEQISLGEYVGLGFVCTGMLLALELFRFPTAMLLNNPKDKFM